MISIKEYLILMSLMLSGVVAHASRLADTGDITIHISCRSVMSISEGPFLIDIYKTPNNTKIAYTLLHAFSKTDSDSIFMDNKTTVAYDSLLNKIVNTSTTELENKEANKNRHHTDGTMVAFTIISGLENRKLYFDTPEPSSNPLVYEFLIKTIALYRDTKNNNFLDIRKTGGY